MSKFKIFSFCNNCELIKDFLICSECYMCICYGCVNNCEHYNCNIICNINKICNEYQIDNYNMITDFIAVGDYKAPYNNFDIIVNLYGEKNGSKHNEIIMKEIHGKKIYNVGLLDKSKYINNTLYLLTTIIPKLYNEKNKKILFHCHAGISRSATFAIAYLMFVYRITINDAYNLVKSKRYIIKPNNEYIKTLIKFSDLINIYYKSLNLL